jgi:uncharacterized RDD family membrane protein YckC
MKCPKCGFNSFDYLTSCKKCGSDVREFKARFNLRSLLFPDRERVSEASFADLKATDVASVAASADADFDYGLMDDDAADDSANGERMLDQGQAAAEQPSVLTDEVSAAQDFSLDDNFENVFQEEPHSALEEGEEKVRVDGEDGDIFGQSAWEEEPLPELDIRDSALEMDATDEEFSGLNFDADDEDEPALPPLEELDFEELETEPHPIGSAEEAFWEEQEAKELQKSAAARRESPEGGTDHPFDGPESAAAVQAPDELLTTDPRQPNLLAVADEVDAAQVEKAGQSEKRSLDDPFGWDDESSSAVLLLPALPARLGAFWLDVFLVVGGFLLFLIIGTRLLAPPGSTALLPSLIDLIRLSQPYYLVFFLVCFGYFTAFHFFIGQTPGKMLFGLRLEGRQGADLQFSEAFLHSVGGLVSLLALGIGYLFALSHPEGRGWNDRIAGTRLVALPAEE